MSIGTNIIRKCSFLISKGNTFCKVASFSKNIYSESFVKYNCY